MAYVVIQTGSKPPMRRAITGVVEVGRGIGPELWIEDKDISRTHCRIFPQEGGWMIEDLQSTNGTYINGAKIEKQALRDGEVILLGNTKIVFHLEDLKEERPTRPEQPTDLSDSRRIDLNATLPHLDRPLPKVSVTTAETEKITGPYKSIAFKRPPAKPILPPAPRVARKKSWWQRWLGK